MLDAARVPPTHALTLTTRDPETPSAVYRDASAYVWKRLRRHYGTVEYFGSIEWTTGLAERSGGQRRLHGHYLVKGLADEDVRLVEHHVREAWRASTGNAGFKAWRIEVAALIVPGAAIHYLNLHHRKAAQAPPEEWRGMVERASRGYWHMPIAELRAEAKLQLRAEAIEWSTGLDRGDALLLSKAERSQGEAEKLEWRALRVALNDERRSSRESLQPVLDAPRRPFLQGAAAGENLRWLSEK
jgi:hypothetical protein